MSVRPYIRYGLNLAGFNVLNYFSRNADNVLVGWRFGGAALGYYSKAYSLLMLPLSQINSPMTKIMLPALSRLQDDPQAYKIVYLKSVTVVLALGFPIVGWLMALNEEVILLILGNQWIGSIAIYKALMPAAFVSALNVTTGWVYLSLGTTDRQLKWTLFAAPLNVLAMWIGSRWGAVGVAYGISVAFVLLRWPYYSYTFRGTLIRCSDVFRVVFRALFSVLCAAFLVLLFKSVIGGELLIFRVCLYTVVYVISLLFVDVCSFRGEGLVKPLGDVWYRIRN
ncbi:oligosaccharide flippase family protein [Sulfuriroseicoccus oceanibius]|uniref:Oligosaccharide flippase family protein n=1 Tax=Sulfuriroseicoccus oceanibius TaxID=2707525 RepID=A0A6B3L2R6_9BACT|nr:oligosaccharide flippase family protein [Sulfuriroseicoccus oceanibius]